MPGMGTDKELSHWRPCRSCVATCSCLFAAKGLGPWTGEASTVPTHSTVITQYEKLRSQVAFMRLSRIEGLHVVSGSSFARITATASARP